MVNKLLFKSIAGKLIPSTGGVNSEGAPAYRFSPEQALAQYAVTGCLNRTFYATAADQLQTVQTLCHRVAPEFIARAAIYSRQEGAMKDMPALLCAMLAVQEPALLVKIFPRVMDSGKLVRNFVQIIRSGATGRKSLGTLPKRLVRQWLERQTEERLFRESVGQSPSLADLIKMVHPRPATPEREALYGYLLGRPVDEERLPEAIRQFEAYKRREIREVPDVPFQLLTGLPLGTEEWKSIARSASWQTTRMNLNTFARHGVFADSTLVELLAVRLADPALVKKARAFPYQLLMTWRASGPDIPGPVVMALESAMEAAIANVPVISGQLFVCPDVSGSMQSSVTGVRAGATSCVRCVDVAALVAAAFLRKNPQTRIIPFESGVVSVPLDPCQPVMANANRLAAVGGGGTNCSAPLRLLNQRREKGSLVLLISDNESWVDAGRGRGTALMNEWSIFRKRNPEARMVCLDLQPNRTTQAMEREDVLNVGGFSDAVFPVIAAFAAGELAPGHWVDRIGAISLD